MFTFIASRRVATQRCHFVQVFTQLAAWCGVPSEAVDALREAANRGLPDPVGAATKVRYSTFFLQMPTH